MGELEVKLYWKNAPMTCRNFAELARRGFYNGAKFHMIIKVCVHHNIIFSQKDISVNIILAKEISLSISPSIIN